jgi:hypothetical protein
MVDISGRLTSEYRLERRVYLTVSFCFFWGDIISLKFAGSDKIGEYMQQGEAP